MAQPIDAGVHALTAGERSSAPLLVIEGLTVGYTTGSGLTDAVRDISLSIDHGQTYGLVGESGSGKTTLALAVLRYLPKSGVIRAGRILFDGQDLLSLPMTSMRRIWGSQIAFVPQDPHGSLNPSIRIGDQLDEALIAGGLPTHAAHRRSLDLLADVGIADPPRVTDSFPHQLSGGMKQRILIAMAISREPSLLVMDEPTTGLDATTQAGVLDLIAELIRRRNTALLYVSHNLGVVARISDRVAVLYAGELMEDASAEELYSRPFHPYTQGILDSVPRLGQNKRRVGVRAIAGIPPALSDLPAGCVFAARCPLAVDICHEHPSLFETGEGHRARCHRWQEVREGTADPHQPAPAMADRAPAPGRTADILTAQGVEVSFRLQRSLLDFLARRPKRRVRAVNGVSLAIGRGRALGLVGESGSGKTTLASAIMGLVERSAGEIRLMEEPLPTGLSGRDRRTLSRLQMIFQDVDESLVPSLPVGEGLRRALARLEGIPRREIGWRVSALIESVRLSPEVIGRLPHQLSGGQRQRVAIARALASNPDLIVADEPVSSLDVSVQAAVLNLLDELQLKRDGSLLFISHDLAVVGFVSDDVAVIYLGSLMQLSPADEIFDPPYHPYTEALLSAIPLIDPKGTQERIQLQGETPSAVDLPSGCPFHTRCPRFVGQVCVTTEPPEQRTESGGMIRCHIPLDDLRTIQQRTFRFSEPIEGLE